MFHTVCINKVCWSYMKAHFSSTLQLMPITLVTRDRCRCSDHLSVKRFVLHFIFDPLKVTFRGSNTLYRIEISHHQMFGCCIFNFFFLILNSSKVRKFELELHKKQERNRCRNKISMFLHLRLMFRLVAFETVFCRDICFWAIFV